MADFYDLTGWRDELEAFAQSKEGRAYFRGETVGKTDKFPFDAILDLARLVLKYDELRKAVRQEVEFRAFLETRPDLSSEDDEYWDLKPVEAAETRKNFVRWCGFKAGLPFSYITLAYGMQLATDLVAGELTSLDYAEASAFSRKHYGTSFIYREEGA